MQGLKHTTQDIRREGKCLSLQPSTHSFWYEIMGDISIFLSVACPCVFYVNMCQSGLVCVGMCQGYAAQSLLSFLSLAAGPGLAQVINKPASIGEDAGTQTPRRRAQGPWTKKYRHLSLNWTTPYTETCREQGSSLSLPLNSVIEVTGHPYIQCVQFSPTGNSYVIISHICLVVRYVTLWKVGEFYVKSELTYRSLKADIDVLIREAQAGHFIIATELEMFVSFSPDRNLPLQLVFAILLYHRADLSATACLAAAVLHDLFTNTLVSCWVKGEKWQQAVSKRIKIDSPRLRCEVRGRRIRNICRTFICAI